jgi:hypothetical protein
VAFPAPFLHTVRETPRVNGSVGGGDAAVACSVTPKVLTQTLRAMERDGLIADQGANSASQGANGEISARRL